MKNEISELILLISQSIGKAVGCPAMNFNRYIDRIIDAQGVTAYVSGSDVWTPSTNEIINGGFLIPSFQPETDKMFKRVKPTYKVRLIFVSVGRRPELNSNYLPFVIEQAISQQFNGELMTAEVAVDSATVDLPEIITTHFPHLKKNLQPAQFDLVGMEFIITANLKVN